VVTFADDLSATGGAEVAQLRVMEGLAGVGWQVDLLFVARGDLWPRWDALAVEARSITGSQLRRDAPLHSGRAAVGAFVALLRARTDVIYVHSPGDLPVAFAAARVKRLPVVLHLHLPPPNRQPSWLNRLIRAADAVIVPSQDAALRWTQEAGVHADRLSVIPTGLETDRFVPSDDAARASQRRALGLDPAVPMILYAGRVDHTKGVGILLDAVRRMGERANLVVCGSGVDPGYADALRRQAEGMNVVWLPRRIDVAPLMGAADLLVLPSLVAETQGLVLIEAMSCGTLAVASAVGGIPDVLADFPERLVPPRDADALAEVIDRLILWRRQRPSLGVEARRWAVERFPLADTVSRVAAVLDGAGR
jgi:glycosyltransferase involved in cell wall biosynthesis